MRPLRGPGAVAPAGSRQQAAGRSPGALLGPLGGLLFPELCTALALSLIVRVVPSEPVGHN